MSLARLSYMTIPSCAGMVGDRVAKKQRGCKQQLPIKEACLHAFNRGRGLLISCIRRVYPMSSSMFELGRTASRVKDGWKTYWKKKRKTVANLFNYSFNSM